MPDEPLSDPARVTLLEPRKFPRWLRELLTFFGGIADLVVYFCCIALIITASLLLMCLTGASADFRVLPIVIAWLAIWSAILALTPLWRLDPLAAHLALRHAPEPGPGETRLAARLCYQLKLAGAKDAPPRSYDYGALYLGERELRFLGDEIILGIPWRGLIELDKAYPLPIGGVRRGVRTEKGLLALEFRLLQPCINIFQLKRESRLAHDISMRVEHWRAAAAAGDPQG